MLSKTLPFLEQARPVRPRRRRWGRTLLLRSFHTAEAGIVLAAGLLLTVVLPDTLEAITSPWNVVAASVAGVLMLELGRREGGMALAWQLPAAAAAGGASLLLAGVPMAACLDWIAAELIVAGLVVTAVRASAGGLIGAMEARGCFATRVAVVGAGPAAHRLADRLRQDGAGAVDVVGLYLPRSGSVAGQATLRGDLRALLSDGRANVVDAIVVALEPDETETLARLRKALQAAVQDLYLSEEMIGHSPDGSAVALGTTPLLRIAQAPQRGWPGRLKRAIDVTAACALLLGMLPALAIIAAAIRIDTRGPVLFRQLRVGYNNRLFHIFKFRSMHAAQTDALAKQQTVQHDRRVTRVGRIIRRFSLDELPQLLNVIMGDMSLVGPRPHSPGTSVGGKRIHSLLEDYPSRHLVRPGITGLAQARGLRGGLTSEEQVEARLAADLEYIRAWSVWLDVRIMGQTVLAEFRGVKAW